MDPVTINGHPFALNAAARPRSHAYHHDYEGESTGALAVVLEDVAKAFDVDPGKFRDAVYAHVRSACVGELERLRDVLESPEVDVEVTDLAIDRDAGLYRFGYCCDVSGLAPRPHGVPLAALGLVTTYIEPRQRSQGTRPGARGGTT